MRQLREHRRGTSRPAAPTARGAIEGKVKQDEDHSKMTESAGRKRGNVASKGARKKMNARWQ